MTFFLNTLKFSILVCVISFAPAWAESKAPAQVSIAEVLANIQHFYVDDIDAKKLNQHAIESIFKTARPPL